MESGKLKVERPELRVQRIHGEFFEFLQAWLTGLGTASLSDVTSGDENPRAVAILAVDLIKGFTQVGVLASRRIAGVVPHVRSLFVRAHALGVRDFVLLQDSHPRDSPQFEAFGPHCMAGSQEEETITELASLPFAGEFTIMRKRSLSPAIGTDFDAWLDARPRIDTVIVVGDCTDLCVYQLAMHVKMRANAAGIRHRVIVPESCVQTYDLSVEAARELAKPPHDADLMHEIFLYHMALNGIEVVKVIDN